MSKITSLHGDAHSATNVNSDTLKVMDSPRVKSRRNGWKRISCFTEGVSSIGLRDPKIHIREKSVPRKENWDQIIPSHSPGARGTKEKFGKEKVHRKEFCRQCEPQERNPCAPKFEDRTLQKT